MAMLYVTIWAAVTLFVASEWGRSRDPVRSGRRWPWWLFVIGLVLALVHTFVSFAVVHGWSHDHALRHTAAQTAAVYGQPFGGGVYVNYAFFAVWGIDAWRWRSGRSSTLWRWSTRAFYFVIVVNAAVIFAAGWRRAAGAILCAMLVLAWGAPWRAFNGGIASPHQR